MNLEVIKMAIYKQKIEVKQGISPNSSLNTN